MEYIFNNILNCFNMNSNKFEISIYIFYAGVQYRSVTADNCNFNVVELHITICIR